MVDHNYEMICRHHGKLDSCNIYIRNIIRKSGKSYLKKSCKICISEYQSKNIERYKKYHKNRFRNDNPTGKRCFSFLRKYNLTKESYQELLNKFNNACAICKKTESDINPSSKRAKRLCIDHCHKTQKEKNMIKVRGILCHKCNAAIGFMHDNSDYFRAAADYLDKFNENS